MSMCTTQRLCPSGMWHESNAVELHEEADVDAKRIERTNFLK
jgi:hypothetical protein